MRVKTQLPPHISASSSVPQIVWKIVAALFPLIGVSLWFYQWDAVRVFAFSVLGSLTAEFLCTFLWKGKLTLYDGSTILTSLLLALMLPPTLPAWMIILGSFFAVFFGKEVFGGLGHMPFHPAIVGRVFLQVTFPVSMSFTLQPLEGLSRPAPFLWMKEEIYLNMPPLPGLLLGNYPGTLGETCIVAILVGGLILFWQRLIYWEVPVLFVLTVSLISWGMGLHPWESVLVGGIIFVACFIITDPVTTPLTREGNRVFSVLAGVLVCVLRKWTSSLEGIGFAILMANALTPWLDQWIRPRGTRSNERGKR
ncbi:MAG: RnfABCDGE type electron transport complex subunit D [Candidatus Omnitrophica bacterium]|nr:RnfABCDGE type electron transport complex subunit D [Candidatus Omnitrophota bacterium]